MELPCVFGTIRHFQYLKHLNQNSYNGNVHAVYSVIITDTFMCLIKAARLYAILTIILVINLWFYQYQITCCAQALRQSEFFVDKTKNEREPEIHFIPSPSAYLEALFSESDSEGLSSKNCGITWISAYLLDCLVAMIVHPRDNISFE